MLISAVHNKYIRKRETSRCRKNNQSKKGIYSAGSLPRPKHTHDCSASANSFKNCQTIPSINSKASAKGVTYVSDRKQRQQSSTPSSIRLMLSISDSSKIYFEKLSTDEVKSDGRTRQLDKQSRQRVSCTSIILIRKMPMF